MIFLKQLQKLLTLLMEKETKTEDKSEVEATTEK